MGPVHVDVVACGAAEELVDGDSERLCLQIQQCVLDPTDRLLDHRARALPRRAEEVPDDPLDRARIALDDERGEILDDPGESARRPMRVGDLRPADCAIVGRRFQEDPGTPAGVAEERLETRNLHPAGGYGGRGRSTSGNSTAPERTSARARSQSSSSSTLKPSCPVVRKGATMRPSRVPVCETTRVQATSTALFCTYTTGSAGYWPACHATARCDWSSKGRMVLPSITHILPGCCL